MALIATSYEGEQKSVLCDKDGKLIVSGLAEYGFADFDDSSPAYVGNLRPDGGWYITKLTTVGAVMTATYCKGDGVASTYATNWTNRAGLTYGTYQSIFG